MTVMGSTSAVTESGFMSHIVRHLIVTRIITSIVLTARWGLLMPTNVAIAAVWIITQAAMRARAYIFKTIRRTWDVIFNTRRIIILIPPAPDTTSVTVASTIP
jgi:deoxyhypusine synthase